MRSLVLTAVLTLCAAPIALAEEGGEARASKPAVVVCDRDGMAERQLKREHGRAEWTNAAEVLRAVETREGWQAPRCMNKLEYWRLSNQLDRLRQIERQRAQAQRVLASR